MKSLQIPQTNFASNPPQMGGESGETPCYDDLERLAAFARAGDETAFRQLVEKYRRLVYSAALRRCGHRELAEEAMQNTFAVLARKSVHLLQHPTLSGWLHRTAMLEASTLLRGERTRRRKHSELMELEAVEHAHASPPPADALELDDALARLPARDRDVILMRFYEGMSFDEIGERLGKSNAACQRRSHRAVRKLSTLLTKSGTAAVGGPAIALALSTRIADATPLSPSSTVAEHAIASSSELTFSTLALNTIKTMSYTKSITAAAITLALLIPVAIQSKESSRLGREITAIKGQLAGLDHSPSQALAAPPLNPAPKLTAIDPPDPRPGEPGPQPPAAAAPSPRSVVTKAFANLKREEIFYRRKYADGVPGPDDPGYADYISEMDGFMRLLAKEMTLMAANESAIEIDDPLEKAEFLVDLLSQAIDLDDPTAAEVGTVLSQRLAENDTFMKGRNSRPEDPELIPEWEAENERLFGSLWDEVHALLSPEEQENLQYGFPRETIVNRSINIGFPGGKTF